MARRRKKKQQSAPGWAWMLLGLSMGLAIALVVYLRSEGPTLVEPLQAARSTPSNPAPQRQALTPAVPAQPAPAPQPEPAGSSGSDDSGSAASLGFYQELGQIEVQVPAIETLAREAQAEDIDYIIQAGSFRTLDEADRRKARLALLGYESDIRRTIVDDAVWFRVIIGPLSERGEINSVRRRLRSENIESMPPRPVSGN